MTVSSGNKRKSTVATATSTTDEYTTYGIRYSCDYCYKDISSVMRIQCAECGRAENVPSKPQDSDSKSSALTPVTISAALSNAAVLEEVDLCVECFAAGVEFGSHLKGHSYRILRPLDFAVFREDWRADEELLLLEAVEANGLGNWNDIAEQLGTRTPEECSKHYLEVYLAAPNHKPTPLTKKQIEASRATLRGKIGEGDRVKRVKFGGSEESLAMAPTPQSIPANHEIAGYMPLRGEFETEIENEAEMAIKDMQFTDDDTEAERSLKFAMLEIYTAVLERRTARHEFIREHCLYELKKHQNTDKSRSKEEKDIYNALKPFARFLKIEDFQTLLDGLVREEELRRQIAHLQDLRRHGIRSFEEVSAYESERKHLELYLKGGGPTHQQPQNATSTNSLLLPSNKPSVAPIKEPHPLPTPVRRPSTAPAAPQPTLISIPRPPPPVSNSPPQPSPPSVSAPFTASQGRLVDTVDQNLHNYQTSLMQPSNGGRKASTPLNISHAEGVELLSEKERHLCSILRLYPRLYLSIKDTLIREYLKLGGLKRAQARAAVKIDVNKTSKLYDFFVAAGWIKPPASGE